MSSARYTRLRNENMTPADADLRPGDVLLKYMDASDGISYGIAIGQKVTHPFKGKVTVVHAAMYLGGDECVEASADGLVKNSMTENLARYKYDVFRHTDEAVINKAIEKAQFNLEKNPKYKIWMAVKSLFKKSSAPTDTESMGLLGEKQLFCSHAVANFYNLAAFECEEPIPIPANAENLTPQDMHVVLESQGESWEFGGTVGKE